MTMPGFVTEPAAGDYRGGYRGSSGASAPGVRLAQSEVFCGVCAMGGFGCGSICHDCGPFGWFSCCDSVCTEPAHAKIGPDMPVTLMPR